ncbi:MAG: DUF814 domain-containing protein [Planctomycetes bacterium]|nr:DUF814 domain-containing protein [Planctomycetota bacterium]
MPAQGPTVRGLSATELGLATAELQTLVGAVVVEAVPLATAAGPDDLLLVLRPGSGDGKVFLHVALGSHRARVAPTVRRFGRDALVRGAPHATLQASLAGATLVAVQQPPGERRCELRFAGAAGERRLAVELFGSRGLWALLDAEGRAVALSRPVETAVRVLRPGDRYQPPPPTDGAPEPGEPRFAPPALAAIDAHFTAVDTGLEFRLERERLLLACRRALQRAQTKAQGLAASLADAGRAAALRAEADLMLAFAGSVARGAPEMLVPDPAQDGALRRIALDPARPVVMQARQRYEKARRLDDSRTVTERRHAEAEATARALAAIEHALAATTADLDALATARTALQRLGVPPKAAVPAAPLRRRPVPRAENYRRFTSAEGYTILVGRDNEQNDRLTLRTANGNDLWLHVGGGRAGSHVVVRLPPQKTASLETLLDAATLAVHFSKARGEPRIDVVYTQRKHVRKPKGLPAGAVVPAQTRTVTVHADAARLQRLLAGGAGTGDDAAG